MFLIVYKNLALFSLIMINCIPVRNKSVLFIQGDQQCYQDWQYAVMAFLGFWVIPFPIALWQSYRLFVQNQISHREMLVCLTLPIATIWYFGISRCRKITRKYKHNRTLYMKVQEIFTEPYRLKKDSKDHYIFWEHWTLIQRLILAAVATFKIIPLDRICYVTPCVLGFIII